MTKGRLGLAALSIGVLVGASARKRGAATAPSPTLVSHQVRREVAAVEQRVRRDVERLDRERRRSAATVLAIAILIVVPAVLVGSRPDVPDAVLAGVLVFDLLVASAALVVAAGVGRDRRDR